MPQNDMILESQVHTLQELIGLFSLKKYFGLLFWGLHIFIVFITITENSSGNLTTEFFKE